ncbi:MAG: glycosyltransferase family 2 protein [Lachnospiraceae bacterium]|nr:glycosyltransferase family 2 protein [Lachnospiraceae bacterium]
MEIRTTIIIPNYNGLNFMEPCFEALEKQTMKDFRVLVVDNGSTDGSVEWLKKKGIPSVFLKENTGFSGAVNTGIRMADTPYVILLNNDTKVDSHYVEAMERAISRSEKIFSVSSRMIQMYAPELMDDAGDMYSVMGWAYQRGVGRPKEYYGKSCRVFSACAGAAIYRRAVFDEIGLFDEMHFAYLEDIDVGYRAKLYGYDNIYCPEAVVYHVGSGTSGSKYNSFKVRLAARNNVYLNYKNMRGWQLLLNSPFLLAGTFVKYLFFKKKGFGTDYVSGLLEGIKTAGRCKRVPVVSGRLKEELKIQLELIFGTAVYVYEFSKRRLAGKTRNF